MQGFVVTEKAVVLDMDDVSTDHIYPSAYLNLTDINDMAGCAFAGVDPKFAGKFTSGGRILVTGNNFASGSSREQAVICLQAIGVKAVIAGSAARIWYRNAINLALPVIICPGYARQTEEGDEISIDFMSGVIQNRTKGTTARGQPWPPHIANIMNHGGVKPMMLAKNSK
jgi:3-isopropylmalate/(R)-2-methylmalate dehydratase small subunit